jgi:hypothetical protein
MCPSGLYFIPHAPWFDKLTVTPYLLIYARIIYSPRLLRLTGGSSTLSTAGGKEGEPHLLFPPHRGSTGSP